MFSVWLSPRLGVPCTPHLSLLSPDDFSFTVDPPFLGIYLYVIVLTKDFTPRPFRFNTFPLVDRRGRNTTQADIQGFCGGLEISDRDETGSRESGLQAVVSK